METLLSESNFQSVSVTKAFNVITGEQPCAFMIEGC